MRREKLSEEEEGNEQKDDGKDEDDRFMDFRYEISHHQIGSSKFVLFKLTLNHLKKKQFPCCKTYARIMEIINFRD